MSIVFYIFTVTFSIPLKMLRIFPETYLSRTFVTSSCMAIIWATKVKSSSSEIHVLANNHSQASLLYFVVNA